MNQSTNGRLTSLSLRLHQVPTLDPKPARRQPSHRLGLVVAIALLGLLWQSQAENVFVDASAAAGGDGSPIRPFQTIQEALTALPDDGEQAEVVVRPGRYLGPIRIDRDWTTLCGAGSPRFQDGYLVGFDDEVRITVDFVLGGQWHTPENLLDIAADHVEVRGFVFDTEGLDHGGAFIGVKAAGDEFLEDFRVCVNQFRGAIDTGIWPRKASGRICQNMLVDGGFVGFNPTGGDGEIPVVLVERNILRNWEAAVCCLGLWEQSAGNNGPSRLQVKVRDNVIADGVESTPVFPGVGAIGLLVVLRGTLTNVHRTSDISVGIEGNLFENIAGPALFAAIGGYTDRKTPGTMILSILDNDYAGNDLNFDARFEAFYQDRWSGNTTLIVADGDGVVDPSQIELGPVEQGNELIVIE